MITIRILDDGARQMLDTIAVGLSRSGLRAIAMQIASDLHQLSMRAFAEQKDPSSGAPWPEPAQRTPLTPGWKSLLNVTGALQRSIKPAIEVGEGGATASLQIDAGGDVIRRGLVHLFGAKKKAKKKSSPFRIPARAWAGYPFGAVRRWSELILEATKTND